MRKYKVALGQINSGSDKEANLAKVEKMIAEAAKNGAKLVVFPENMNAMGLPVTEICEDLVDSVSCRRVAAAAKANNIYVNLGSIKERIPGEKRVYNTSVLFDNNGKEIGVYRKIHLCDMNATPGKPISRESDNVHPGDEIVTVDTELGTLGMSICYDIRFAELYRLMALKGAQVLMVPACFGRTTGAAHWELLNRTRAVENGCYVLACGQCGLKPNGVKKNGTSMIIDPYGRVIARGNMDDEALIYGDIDLDYAEAVIGSLGSIFNRRTDIYELKEL